MAKKKGLMITFEGMDGTGKSTQAKLLAKKLRVNGYRVKIIDFPQHGEASSYFVDKLLRGEYGNVKKFNPYRASIFFACDRYDASFRLKKWLDQGFILISDRYVGSNIGFQGGKILNRIKRKKFIKWLFDLEYNIFQIPKPDITFLLNMPFNISQKLNQGITDKQKIKRKVSYMGKLKKDEYEKDLLYQRLVGKVYLDTAKMFPKMFKVINCYQNNRLLSPSEISQIIWNKIESNF
jgi:dTMP kinase